MPPLPQSIRMVRRAEAALFAGIEIYNKPDFAYREETFSILMLNAWELLLKGKVLADSGNDLRSIYAYETRETKQRTPGKKLYLKRNRSGNPLTIGLGRAITKLDANAQSRLPAEVKANLDALTEIRDNSSHFVAASPLLAKQVLEIGTAAVSNFIELASRWFHVDFARYKLYLMPIGFLRDPGPAAAIVLSTEEERAAKYILDLVAQVGRSDAGGFHVALQVDMAFKRAPTAGAIAVRTTNDPDAPKVQLTEENIRHSFPWDYKDLTKKCRDRYSDFKEGDAYHKARKPLDGDGRFAKARFLDPSNPKSGRKVFYNPNIFTELDKHFTRK